MEIETVTAADIRKGNYNFKGIGLK